MHRMQLLLLNWKDSHGLWGPIPPGNEKDKFKHTPPLARVFTAKALV